MSDARLRERQRAWETNPGDQDALAAYIAALRGAGEIVPLELLGQRVFPARTLNLQPGWSASFKTESGMFRELRPSEGATVVEVPEHRGLSVSLALEGLDPESWRALAAEDVRHVSLDCRGEPSPTLEGCEAHSGLEVLCLSRAEHLTGADLNVLGSQPSLYCLETDQTTLSGLPPLPSLQVVELGAVARSDLQALVASAPGLRSLTLSGSNLTEADYELLRLLRGLEALELREPLAFTLEALVELRGLSLRRLSIWDGCDLPEESLRHISEVFPNLQELDLVEAFEDLGPLSSLPLSRLRLVRFADARQLEEESLHELPQTLETIDLSAELGDEGLRALARLDRLRDLDLQLSQNLTGNGLSVLGALPLRSLRLSAHAMAPDAFAELLKLETLTALDLQETTSEQVAQLGHFPQLESLTLHAPYGSSISSRSLGCLEHLPLLDFLSLSRAEIGSAFQTSHGLQHLAFLSVFFSEITPATLADIAECKALTFLHFLSCGQIEGAEVLTSLQEISFLGFTADAALSAQTVAYLEAHLPDDVLDMR